MFKVLSQCTVPATLQPIPKPRFIHKGKQTDVTEEPVHANVGPGDVRSRRTSVEETMRHEFLSWLRMFAVAGAVVALLGLVITAGRPVLELVALR